MHPLSDWTPDDLLHTITDGMNPSQSEAVQTTEGPLLILAGAGSGKTRVLTRRIAYILAQQKARRNQIMAVTFTNKAAKEMAERIEQLCGRGRFPDLGTFHAVCARWLRREAETLGISPQFAIYATAEQLVVMKESIKELGLDEKRFTPRGLLSQVSHAKNAMLTPHHVMVRATNPFERHVAEVYARYQRKLGENGALDFDDILLKTVEMLRDYSEIREAYQERLRYVLVDEYQDVNLVQYELLRLVSQKHRNLCAVGDDDQSIYAFRGADVSIMLNFEKDFSDARVIKLEQNYRSTQTILDAAHAVVQRNTGRKAKKLWTERSGGDPLHVFLGQDGREEGRFIATEIRRTLQARAGYSDYVILYRTNSQSRLLEEAMIQHSIPYKIVGGLRFFERKEIKDVLAYLAILVNPQDGLAARRILGHTKGIGATTLEKLVGAASERELTLWEAFRDPARWDIKGPARQGLLDLTQWVDALRETLRGKKVTEVVTDVLEKSGYLAALEAEGSVEAKARLENLDELINVTAEFDRNAGEATPQAFLAEVSLLSDQDTYAEDAQAVTLMTLHAAKGLEFPVVFLAGLEEETFPHARSIQDEEQMEEERRLCYVGITRAKEKLFLTAARVRELQGARIERKASRFLSEIPKELIHLESNLPRPRSADSSPAIGSGQFQWGKATASGGTARANLTGLHEPAARALFAVGEKVHHKTLGPGEVQGVARDIVTVLFDSGITKQLNQNFLQPAAAAAVSTQPLAVGNRVQHARLGNGIVKSMDARGVSVQFGTLLMLMPADEAARLPRP